MYCLTKKIMKRKTFEHIVTIFFVLFVGIYISFGIYKTIQNDGQFELFEKVVQLEDELGVNGIKFVEEDPKKVFVWKGNNQYRYATNEEKEKLSQFYNLLSEKQKNRYHDWFFISEETVEKLFFCEDLGIRSYELKSNGLSATVTDLNKETMEATLEEWSKIKEFEELH